MAEELKPDICVIGGGPGGIAVAAAAANCGIPVVLVEKGRMGGSNLSRGGVPSKALLAAASHNEFLRRGPAIGVTGAPLQVNFAKVRDHVNSVVEAVAPNVSAERLAALGVRIVAGEASFVDRQTVVAGDTTIRARRFVVATGAVPRPPALPGLADIDYMTLDTAFDLNRKPAHLLVIGAGAYGLELAQAYARLGVDATVIDEGLVLPDDDPELVAVVLDRLRAEGIRVRAGVKVTGLARRRGGIRITLTEIGAAATVDGSHVLVATGRAPAIAGLGLDAARIAHDENGIAVDRLMRTSNRRVYAIGDVVAGPATADRAEYEASRVLSSILYRWPHRADPFAPPVVAFTDPALARVGMSEVDAARRYNDIRILRSPFLDNDLAQAERTTAGAIKVVVRPNGRILGATIVGRDAGEMIGLWSLAIAQGLPIGAVASMVPPYPSRMEISRRVAASFDGPGQVPRWRRQTIDFLRKFG